MLICPTVFLKMKRECTLVQLKYDQNGHKCYAVIPSLEKRKK